MMSEERDIKRFWLSIHIYHESTSESLLAEILYPFLQAMQIAGFVRQFFFIRYFDQSGPHIRLRLEGDYETMLIQVQPQLELTLNSLLGDHFIKATEASEAFEGAPVPEGKRIETLQYINYIPETDRFAGKSGLRIAEDQFAASSKAVLEAIFAFYPEWDYDQAMGAAIRLHLALLHGSGMEKKKMAEFFHLVCLQWLPRAFPAASSNMTAEHLALRESETLAYFENSWQQQETALKDYIQAIFSLLDSGQAFEDIAFEDWRLHSITLWTLLEKAYSKDLLTPRPLQFVTAAFEQLSEREHLLFHLYADFVHLTNNRLGISNRDEGFLAYILWKALS